MKFAIELNATQTDQLEEMASSLGVDAKTLVEAAVVDLIHPGDAEFDAAAARVLAKNRELYRRLA